MGNGLSKILILQIFTFPNIGVMGKSLWLLASMLAIAYGTTMVTQLTNLMRLCPTRSLVYGDTLTKQDYSLGIRMAREGFRM